MVQKSSPKYCASEAQAAESQAPAHHTPHLRTLHPAGSQMWCEFGQVAAHGMRIGCGTSVGTSLRAAQPWAPL